MPPFYGMKGRDDLVAALLAQQGGGNGVVASDGGPPALDTFAREPGQPLGSFTPGPGYVPPPTTQNLPPLFDSLLQDAQQNYQVYPNLYPDPSTDAGRTNVLRDALGLMTPRQRFNYFSQLGGDGGFGNTSGVTGGDVGSPPGGSPPGGSPPGGSPPGGPPPGGPPPTDLPPSDPYGNPSTNLSDIIGGGITPSGAPAGIGITGQGQSQFGDPAYGTPAAPGTPAGAAGTTGKGGFAYPDYEPPFTTEQQMFNYLSDRENALQAFNQAAPVGQQGGFSTAGMSLSDLAEAWGVGLDSAAALAEAGFADLGSGGLGGGGFGGFGDSPEAGVGDPDAGGGEPDSGGQDSPGGGGGGGAAGEGDDDGDGDY